MEQLINDFFNGILDRAYDLFGAHINHEYNEVRFTVWAPNAKNVQVKGDFNYWNGDNFWLKKIDDRGIWSGVFKDIYEYSKYKYNIEDSNGIWREKSDPYAFFSEVRPDTASVVYNIHGYPWRDNGWIESRKSTVDKPMSIYEVHFGSWMKKGEDFYTYEEMVGKIIPYVKGMGYTHIEIMPLAEHPFDGSWGYQTTGYYSATSRYGDPKKLMYFIDECHLNGIGVIMDWVPVHFCKDAHGLIDFDGGPTYEYPFDDLKDNVLWGTRHFDLGKNEVISFLVSNANYWFDMFHVDGIRADAVNNIIYFFGDSTRGVNEAGINFLKKLNEVVHSNHNNILMIAEDSSSYPNVTEPTYNNGLGFDYKWNMGWMNDVLKYQEQEFNHRSEFHKTLTFSMMYAYNEKFILPFSHDEVVHGKRSMLDKMPGDYWQKFAALRALFGYMFTHPGKKLLFMGSDFGQFIEWNENKSLDWSIKDYPMHNALTRYVKDLNDVYKYNSELYELDHDPNGFLWIDVNNAQQGIYSYIRKDSKGGSVVVISNFKPISYTNYQIGVLESGTYYELLNSDKDVYGGSNIYNGLEIKSVKEYSHGKDNSIYINVPPLSTIMLKRK